MSQAKRIERLERGVRAAVSAGNMEDARRLGALLREAMGAQTEAAVNDDLPSGGDLPGTPLTQPEGADKREFSVQETFLGALETAGALITSPLAVPATMLGAVDGAVGSVMAGYKPGSEEFNRNMRGRQEQVVAQSMYQPQTEAGQQYMSAVGEVLAPLEVIEPLMPALAGMIPNVAQAGRADMQQSGVSRNLDGPSKTELEVQKRVEAARTGGQSLPAGQRMSVGAAAVDGVAPNIGPDNPAQMIANRFVDEPTARMYRDASPETRQGMINMLGQAERLAEDPSAKNSALPRSVVGDEIGNRASVLGKVRKRYGERLKSVVEENKDTAINTEILSENFDAVLASYNITRNSEGSFNLNGSRISDAATQKKLKGIYGRMGDRFDGGQAKFGDLHIDKQWLQDQVQYGPGSGSNNLNALLKDLANEVNQSLRVDKDGNLTDYAKANDAYSSTVRPFEEIAKIAGVKATAKDLDDPRTIASLARTSRGLTNNTKQGVDLEFVLGDLEKLIGEAVERGAMTAEEIAALGFDPKTMEFKADIGKMGHFAASLDTLFPQMRPTSLGALLDQSAQTGVDAATSAGARAIAGDKIGALRDTAAAMGSTDRKVAREAAARAERLAAERKLREEVVESLFDMLER